MLSKGLSFVSDNSGSFNYFGVKVDLFKCLRQIKLKHFFSKTPVHLQVPLFQSLNQKVNSPLMYPILPSIHSAELLNRFGSLRTCHRAKREPFLIIYTDKDFVFKPAEMGGALVVQDANKYWLAGPV